MEGSNMKELFWYPACKTDFDNFPPEVQQDLGYQLHLLQSGHTPDDFKPLKSLDKEISGVFELRYRDENDIFRVAYVAKFDNVIVVLHSWQKKTQRMSKNDLDLIVKRYKEVKNELL